MHKKIKTIAILIFILIGFFQSLASAYIPPTNYILQRAAELTPRVPFEIEYELTFLAPNAKSLSVTERWVGDGAGHYKMKATGGLNLEIIYSPSERSFQDKVSRKTQKLSGEFIEKSHFLKTPDQFHKMMIDFGVPTERMQNPILSKAAGVVNYGFFERVPLGTEVALPGLWIEQDQFLIRQIRFKSQALLQMEDYQSFGKTSFFPKVQLLRWGKYEVKIKTLKVVERKSLRPQELNQLDTTLDLSQTPAEIKPAVLEFYSRFR